MSTIDTRHATDALLYRLREGALMIRDRASLHQLVGAAEPTGSVDNPGRDGVPASAARALGELASTR